MTDLVPPLPAVTFLFSDAAGSQHLGTTSAEIEGEGFGARSRRWWRPCHVAARNDRLAVVGATDAP